MKKKLYILDVSGYIFRAYYALPPMSSPKGEATNALFGFIRSVIKLLKDFQPKSLVAVFDGPENKKQRQEIYDKYKTNRIRLHEDLPEQIERSRQFCELLGIPVIEVPGVEADDTIGSVAVWAKKEGSDVYICTSDKDLCQLVQEGITVVNTWKDNLLVDREKVKEIYGVYPESIVDLLALMGDTSDNIPGVKGIGPKTGIQLLEEFSTLENLLANLDKVKGKKQELLQNEADVALLSKRLATIYTDIPFPKEEDFFSLKETDLFELKEFYIEMGFNTLVQEMDEELKKQAPIEIVKYTLVNDKESFAELLLLLKNGSTIAFEVETTALSAMDARAVGIGFSLNEKEAYYVPLNGNLDKDFALDQLRLIFENPTLKFYGHNIKYDLHVLAGVGIQPNICFDTMLASYLLHSGGRRHTLDVLALQYYGKVKTPIKSLIGSGKKEISMEEVPLPKMSEYCCEDVDYTCRLKSILEKDITKRKLTDLLYQLELPLTFVLARMERSGVFVDVPKLHLFSKEITKEISLLEKEIYDMAGEEFNLSSPKQLSVILFEKLQIKPLKKTATGLSTRAEVLETLALEYPIAEKILSFRLLEKLRSTYVDALPLAVNQKTGRIHPTFNQFVTATGRLACQDPNLQNIPVRGDLGKKIREAFRPEKEGWSYVSADYSQIELRLLAHLSDDPKLIHAFNHGDDIHAYTASLVFETPLAKVTSNQRDQAKAINFGIIYGQQAYGLSQVLGIEVKKAADFIEAYFERYPAVMAFIQTCIEQARKEGKARTMIGREREIPEILSSNAVVRSAAERLAINTPLQGSAADLIKLAMLEIDRLLVERKLQSFMVLQVHDELIFEVPDEEISIIKPLVKQAMENVFSLKVPLVVDVKVGKNWAEC